VLAAHALNLHFCVPLDERRPDLIEHWYRVMSCVRSTPLRTRCKVLTRQELSRCLPIALQRFLADKYGIRSTYCSRDKVHGFRRGTTGCGRAVTVLDAVEFVRNPNRANPIALTRVCVIGGYLALNFLAKNETLRLPRPCARARTESGFLHFLLLFDKYCWIY
jgi:hypothetical protein